MNIFISHSHSDKATVLKIAEDLKRHGITTWLDEELITPGDNWLDKISRAVENSDAILVIISRNTGQSRWQTSEIAFAVSAQRQNTTKKVIPILIDKEAEVPFFLKDRSYCDLSSKDAYARNFDQLIKALQKPIEAPEDIEQAEKTKIESIRVQKEFLESDVKELDRKKALWSSSILGAIASMIAALVILSFGFWTKFQWSLDGLKFSNEFVVGVLAGVVSSLIAVMVGRAFYKRTTGRGAKNGK